MCKTSEPARPRSPWASLAIVLVATVIVILSIAAASTLFSVLIVQDEEEIATIGKDETGMIHFKYPLSLLLDHDDSDDDDEEKVIQGKFNFKLVKSLKTPSELAEKDEANRIRKSEMSPRSGRWSRRNKKNNKNAHTDVSSWNLLEINIERIYTPWTKWSRCKRKCKQVRKRYCTVPPICGTNVLKEERPCKRGRCRRNKNFHIVKRRKLSRKTRGMLKFNRAFYSKWSKWTSCSSDCKTTRTRSCKFSMVCGSSAVHEQAYCYKEGSLCEELFLQGKSLSLIDKYRQGEILDGHNDHDDDNEKRGNKKLIEKNQISSNNVLGQCGLRKSEEEHQSKSVPPAWSLKIIGGREARRGHWPWQVAILNKYKEVFCGGTLIAPGWILTAAHCVRKHLYVRMGEHDLVIREGTEREYFVEHSVLHPSYDPDTVDNDVALLRIPIDDLPGEEDDHLHPNVACLPSQNQPLPQEGRKCSIIGWGKEKSSHVYGTDVLHEAEIPIVSKSECLNVYKEYFITGNMFCAGYRGGRIDSCAGDSGGPLLCEAQDGRWTIFGVTSFGEGCGQAGKFGIYAKVPNFVDWIHSVINYTR